MNRIYVETSKPYEVLIGKGLLQELPHLLDTDAKKLALVSDSNVWPLYGKAVEESLKNAGFHVLSYVFPAGEESKNGSTYLSLLSFLAANTVTRGDLLIALGGGVVGDLTGFAAATYLRGVDYIQIPTTLLSAVDSSVGGKTAIDLPEGKNLAGAFYQPKLVVCDTDTLSSLPRDVFLDGCAEVIKYGILFDKKLFAYLGEKKQNFDLETVIARCVELKAQVVRRDEFDTGERMLLNLGHTVGHGIEKCSHFTVSHGKAVAMGTAIVTRAAMQRQLCSQEAGQRILEVLKGFGLPVATEYTVKELLPAMLGDKKRSGAAISVILPHDIGDCRIHKLPTEELQNLMEAGM